MTTASNMPPHSLEAEKNLIGSILREPDFVLQRLRGVSSADFHNERHGQIFSAILDLLSRGEPIDTFSVIDRLKNEQQGREDDGSYISACLADTPSASDAGRWARTVKRLSLHRRLYRLGQIIKEARDLNGNVDKFGTEFEAIRAELAQLDGLQARDPWASQIFNIEDAFKIRPVHVDLIAGTIRKGSLILWGGEPDSLKSLLLQDALVAISLGKPWLPGENGGDGRVTAKARALWLDADNGLYRLHGRTEALHRGYVDNPPDSLFQYASFLNPPVNLAEARSGQMLVDYIKLHKIDIVALDNLKSFSGSSDENSGEMAVVMATLRLVVETTGVTLCPVHHTTKKSEGKNLKNLFRGHGSILAAVDYAFLLQREPDSDIVTVQTAKSRDVIIPSFAARFWYKHKEGGSELLKAGFCAALSDKEDSDLESAIIQAVPATGSIGLRELSAKIREQGVKARQTRINEMVKRMGQAGRFTLTPGIKGALKISL